MPVPSYLPTVSSLIPFERMPGELGFLRDAMEPVFSRIFYKDLFIATSATGEAASYDLTLAWFQRLALEVPGSDGLALVLFPEAPGNEVTQVPIAFGYHWPILRYLEYFEGPIPTDPQEWFDLFIDIFAIDPADLLIETVSVLIEETDPVAAFAENFPPGTLNLDIPPGEDVVGALIAQIGALGLNLPRILFNNYILSSTPEQTFRRLVRVFERWIGAIEPEELLQVVVPQVFAELVSIPVALEFPRSWMVPLGDDDSPISDPQVRSRINFNAGKITFSSLEGLQFHQQGQFSFSKSELFGSGITLAVQNGTLRFEDLGSEHHRFRVRGQIELTFPASIAQTDNGQPLVVTSDAEIDFEAPGTVTIQIHQFGAGATSGALSLFPPGLDGFGVIVDRIDSARVTVALGPGSQPHFEVDFSIAGFRLRLPQSLMTAVTKGFNIDATTMRRLRKTPLDTGLLDELGALADQPFSEDAFLVALNTILENSSLPAAQQSAARAQILAYAVNWIPEVDPQGEVLPRDLIIESELSLRFDSAGAFHFDVELPTLYIDPVMLGQDSNVVVEASELTLQLDTPEKGLSFASASLYLPPDLPAAPDLTISDCFIGGRGFSGTVTADWVLDDVLDRDGNAMGIDGELTGELVGFTGGLSRISLTFVENFPTQSDVHGKMMLPGFEGVMDVQIALQEGGSFSFTLLGAGEEGVVLTQQELMRLNLKRLTVGYDHRETEASLVVSGGLEPLLMASDGLQWPRLDVTDLAIEKNLAVLDDPPVIRFKEAWLDLKDLATLDLWGFHFELNRIGIGYEVSTDKLWLDLTGSLRLIELIPIGLGVEGFRITWPRLLYEEIFAEIAEVSGQGIQEISVDDLDLERLLQIASKIEVRFDGLYLFYGVPQAVEFEGLIRFIKEAQTIGFAGDVELRLPASGFSAEAGLMVGVNFAGDPALPGIPLPYLYVYLGIELPSGIPLGQSGLALKGALGLFGLNVAPDKTPEQNWYYDWYKRAPFVGVHQTNKWRFEKWSIAFGAGVTITTTGTTIVGVRGLLALVLPGPIILIEGRALIFEGLLPLEPPLRAMAVFDGPARTLQLNIEAEAELVEGIVEAYAMAEAFFDFKDLTNWHLYLGQDEPKERRIHANLLKLVNRWLFDANAFLMLDMIDAGTLRARLGLFVGFTPPIPPLGPVTITLEATLEGEGLVTVLPEHFSGRADLSATVGLSAFGFNMLLDAGANIQTQGASPLIVDGLLQVHAEFPSPTEPFESLVSLLSEEAQALLPEIEPLSIEAEFSFHWESPETPEITAPLALVTIDGQRGSSQGGQELPLLASQQTSALEHETADASPVAALDGRPTLVFNQDMMQGPDLRFGRHPDGAPLSYTVGPIRFTPELQLIRLYRKAKVDPWETPWELTASTETHQSAADLWGVWMADADLGDAGTPAVRRLRIWTDQPFHNPGTLGTPQLPQGAAPGSGLQSYTQAMLLAYPEYYDHEPLEPRWVCTDFAQADTGKLDTRTGWSFQSVTLEGDPHAEIVELTKTTSLDPPEYRPEDLWQALQRIDAQRFKRVSSVTPRQLHKWAATVPASQQFLIYTAYPRFKKVWLWLWPQQVKQRCLWVSASYITPDKEVRPSVHCFHFDQRVTQAKIELCDALKLSAEDLHLQVQALRRRRTVTESEKIRQEAERAGIEPDYDACRFAVNTTVTLHDRMIEVTADEGDFECLCLTGTELVMAEICFLAAGEQERVLRAGDQDAVNDTIFPSQDDPFPLFVPGYYYKLEIKTRTLADLQLPSPDSDPVTDAIYQNLIFPGLEGFEPEGDLIDRRQRSSSHLAYFQTSDPPHQLAPYIKWTYPEPNAVRIFRNDECAVRFRRHYLNEMFHPGSPWSIDAQLIDTAGEVVDGYAVLWRAAGTATVTPDEQGWLQHLGLADTDRPADDLLRLVRTSTGPSLEAGQRYELRLTGGAGGTLLYQDDWGADSSVESTLPKGWQRQDGTVQRTGTKRGRLEIGTDTWSDIDTTVEVSLSAANNRVTLTFRDNALPDRRGGPSVRQYYRLDFLYNPRIQAHSLSLDFVAEPPAGPHTWKIAKGVVRLPRRRWSQIRVQIIGNRVKIWFAGIEQFDIDLQSKSALPGDPPSADPGNLAPRILRQGRVSLDSPDLGVAFRRMSVRDAVLHRIPFVASRFRSFRRFAATNLKPVILKTGQVSAQIVDGSVPAAVVAAKLHFAHGLVDHQDQLIDREHLESLRLILREAEAAMDSRFREIAETYQGGLVYQPVDEALEVFILRSTPSGKAVAIWLKNPEDLDLRISTAESGAFTGRTTVTLSRGTVVKHQLLSLSDGTQALLMPPDGTSWPQGRYKLTLRFQRDYGDEATNRDHRYDRPIFYPVHSEVDNRIKIVLQL